MRWPLGDCPLCREGYSDWAVSADAGVLAELRLHHMACTAVAGFRRLRAGYTGHARSARVHAGETGERAAILDVYAGRFFGGAIEHWLVAQALIGTVAP